MKKSQTLPSLRCPAADKNYLRNFESRPTRSPWRPLSKIGRGVGLLAVAAGLLGAASAFAQSNVYSSFTNIISIPNGYSLIANQLDHGSNTVTEVLTYQDGDNIGYWNGTGWDLYMMDSGSTTGWFDPAFNEVQPSTLPKLTPGKGLLYGRTSGATTITFTGTPHVPVLPAVLPYGYDHYNLLARQTNDIGTYENVTGLSPQEGAAVLTWTGANYLTNVYTSGAWSMGAPSLAVGQSAFFNVPHPSPPPCTSNLVVNGGFETTAPPVPPNSARNALDRVTGVPGWTTDVGQTLEVWGNTFNGLPASEGTNHMEINANSNDQTVWQVVSNLSVGCPTTVCFDYNGRFGLEGSTFNNDFTFSLSGGYTFSVDLDPIMNLWTNYCVSFTPTTPVVTISFRGHPHYVAGQATEGGAHIDNVSLIQCCPATNPPCTVIINCPTNKSVPCCNGSAGASPVYTVLKSFTTANSEGYYPAHELLTEGDNGALYGTTSLGGVAGAGVVFKINKDGTGYTVVKDFNGTGASFPSAGLLKGSDGALYGTAGGGCGMVFKLNQDGSGFQVLHSFAGATADGCNPTGGLLEGSDGYVYGTTVRGGLNDAGTVFKISKNGASYSVLRSCSNIGGDTTPCPQGNLAEGSDGFLYGTTSGSGSGDGTVFKLMKDGTGYAVLHSFVNGSEGRFPVSGVIAAGGALYGTTSGNNVDNNGTVFKLNENGSGFSVLEALSSATGQNPGAPLVAGTDGMLYGTTSGGGSGGGGTVFRVNKDGTGFAVVLNFASAAGDAYGPESGLISASDGALYGVSHYNYSTGPGTVYKLAVSCGSMWSFDPPVVVSNSCCATNFMSYTTVTNTSSCPVITRTWKIWDNCGNTNFCHQSVSFTDTNPPVFVTGCNTNVYFAGGNTSFVTPTPTSPRPALLARLQQAGITPTRKFDECAVNEWFAQSFTNLPKCISAAYLEIRVKPCGDICGNDAMHLWFAGSANSNTVFSQYFGGGNPRAGLATNDWCSYAGNPQTFVLDLSNLPASGGGPANILPLLEANGFLDVTLQDDTGVDYVKLTVVSCCGNATKTVESSSHWFFDTPIAVDDCCPNPTVTVLKITTNGTCPKIMTCTWVATDCCGNTNVTSQEVTVTDTTPPVIRMPGDIKHYTCDSSMVVNFNVTATDAGSGALTPVCFPPSGSIFGVGTTTVNCTATDACGNTTNTSFTVTVVSQSVTKSITLGTKDCFTLPEEPATRSAQLNAKFPTANWRNFDSLADNKPFGVSFLNLPKNLTCARLEITMRPVGNNVGTTNDSISAVLGTNGVFAYSSHIGNDFGGGLTPASWRNQAGCGQTFTIDLAAYLSTINAQRQVDVYIQDDTAVDYATLTYCYCDKSTVWNTTPVDSSDLPYISPDWLTYVAATPTSNITATVDLNGAAAFRLNLGDLNLGTDPSAAFTINPGSIANPSGSAVTLKPGAGSYIGLSVSDHSAAVNSVRALTLQDDLVVSDSTMSPGAAAGNFLLIENPGSDPLDISNMQIAVDTQSPLAATNGVEAAYTIKFNQAVNIRSCTNCTPVLADSITVLLLKNPDTTADLLTGVTLSAIGVPEVNVGTLATKVGNAWVSSGGEANAAAAGNQLTLTAEDGASTNSMRMFIVVPATNRVDLDASIAQNTITFSPQSAIVKVTFHMPALEIGLGSSGQDGFGLGSSGQDGIGLGSSGQDGFWLGSSGQDGYGLGSSGQDGVEFTFTQTGSGLDITPDYTALGTSTTHFMVYNGGVLMADVSAAGPASIIGLPVQLPPLRYGLGSSGQDGVCVMNWVAPQSIVINGNTYLGNELRATPLAADLHPPVVSGIRVEATGVDELTLHSLSVPAAQWRMLPLQVEDGTLNVQWTGPAGAALESAPALNGAWTAVSNQNALSAKLPAPGGTNAPAKLFFRMHAN